MDRELPALIELFAREFAATHRTRLVAGGDEPLYRPATTADGWHEIVFRHDYFQSALHEVAHWCVAGEARRRLPDYGYWYSPDGRTRAQQDEFEQVEARPQAVEWVLTAACGRRFAVSLDNLDAGEPLDEASLWRAVYRELQHCMGTDGGRGVQLPPRAAQFARALARQYEQPWPLPRNYFVLPAGATGFSGITSFGGVNSTV
ncbi:MAG: elongation factor P hydroxylase [Pseudomonadota bacterium]